MKHLYQILLILLMLWTSAVSYATESDVYGCHKIENNANKTVIDAGLTAQLLDNIDDDTRTKIQLAALVAAGPEIGISLVEAVSATRLLRTRHATKPYAVSSANDVRLALAQKDLEGFADAWDFVRTNPKGADAWEAILESEEYRRNVQYLRNTEDYLNRTGSSYDDFIQEFDQFPDSKNIFLDELADTPASGTHLNNPDGVWNQGPTTRGFLLEDVASAVGVQTPRTFPKIDYYDLASETATSVKSTDLFANSYQDLVILENLWKKYVDNISGNIFPITSQNLTVGDIFNPVSNRTLHIVIPHQTPLGNQLSLIDVIKNYGNSKGINVIFENID